MENNNEMQDQRKLESVNLKSDVPLICKRKDGYKFVNTNSDFKNFCNLFNEFMLIKIFVNSNDPMLKQKYVESSEAHNRKIINNPDEYDAGFDIYFPEDVTIDDYVRSKKLKTKINYNIKCCAGICSKESLPSIVYDEGFCSKKNESVFIYNPTAFYTYARSSISNSCFRLANNQGIIDAGYRGDLMAVFDIINEYDDVGTLNPIHVYNKFTRVMQICAPNLMPICVQIVDQLSDLGGPTSRGEGGFGSTGVV